MILCKGQPDITLAKTLLGWEPEVIRKEGMLRTLNYFKGFTNEEASEK